MSVLDHVVLGNSVLSWGTAATCGLMALLGMILLRRFILNRLGVIAGRTETQIDDVLVDVFGKTKFIILLLVSAYIGAQFLVMHKAVALALRVALVSGLMLQAAIWTNKLITTFLQGHARKRMQEDASAATAVLVMGFLVKLVVWSIFLLLALDNLGINVTGIIAGLGIGGVAVALALQNILGDIFASMSIVLDRPFSIGDFLIVGDFLGTVEYIGLKTTRIRSLSGEQIVFPNGEILKSRIRNFRDMKERRVVFSFGVTFQTPAEKVAAIGTWVREIIEGKNQVRFDRAHFKAFGVSELLFEVVYYLLDPDYNLYMDVQQEINLDLFRVFKQEGISFAYPTHTVFLSGQDKLERLEHSCDFHS